MNDKLIKKLNFSLRDDIVGVQLPPILEDSLHLIADFFKNNSKNKLCLVFPSKEYAAQWLTIPTVLSLIESNFTQYKDEISESLKKYKKGDWIILNNEAIVEWVGRNENGFVFKHKEFNGIDKITIDIRKISKIQPAPTNRNALSGYKRVIDALSKKNENHTDKLLGIQTDGNRLFQKNSVCLISKHIKYENCISEISLNSFLVDEYFKQGKIDENGEIDMKSPLLISNNLSNLALYVTLSDTVSKIIIDGYSAIQERGIDFNDIDAKNISTILITDLSEIESFENIGDYGFDFFNFCKENIQLDESKSHSPFHSLDKKLRKYISFKLLKEICKNEEFETLTRAIHSIDEDDNVKEIMNLKISLIQLTNLISRIAHPLNESEIQSYYGRLHKIESQFVDSKFYLGSSTIAIEKSTNLLKSIINRFSEAPSEKCLRLKELISGKHYDYIICTSEDEVQALSSYLNTFPNTIIPKIISVADVNNNLLTESPIKAILTGWAKSKNINRILSSFLFSELTVLFYQFEGKYFNSLQRRNKRFSANIKSTINRHGIGSKEYTVNENGFDELYIGDSGFGNGAEEDFDIVDIELKIDNAQFSKYIVKGNSNESIKARRVEFRNDKFIYLTDTHGLHVLENFNESNITLHIHKSRIENLHHGDVIAFIKTERELLNQIVSKQTTPADLAATTKWIDLWKVLLRGHFINLEGDFWKLVGDLRDKGCKRDPITIRSWLFDDLRIGPRNDDDLISIALMTNGLVLYNNIKEVRNAIRQMTSWRMRASDFVIEQLKSKIKRTHKTIQVNSTIDFDDLGEVEILEISEINNTQENIDIRNVNRLIEKAKF